MIEVKGSHQLPYWATLKANDILSARASTLGGSSVAPISAKAPGKFEGFTDKVKEHLCALFKPSLPHTRSLHTLFAFQQSRINAATGALASLGKDTSVLRGLAQGLEDSRFKDDRVATKAELKAARHLEKDLIGLIASQLPRAGMTSKEAMREAKAAFHAADVALLNGKDWNKVETGFEHNNQEYVCTMVPAAQMTLGRQDIFPVSYDGKGVCCSSRSESQHVPNLWTSEIRVPGEGGGQILFKGVRHGILSPFGLEKGSVERHEGSLNRAREVVAAALYARPELLDKAMKGDTVPLRLVSTSLVTGGVWHEHDMLADQVEAWRALCAEDPTLLQLRGDDDQLHPILVNLEVAAFNFGVNELALKFKLGQAQADGYNVTALHQLLGDDLRGAAEPGGWVGEYLSGTSGPDNRRLVRDLSRQLKQIWADKAHNREDGDPFKGALCAQMLAFQIGAVPCSNCKSGKDRTGMLDAEVKRAAVTLYEGKTPGSRLTEDEKLLLQKILLHGGNLEIQAYNTGAPGNKVMRDPPLVSLSYHERVGNDEVWSQVQGLSQMVEA